MAQARFLTLAFNFNFLFKDRVSWSPEWPRTLCKGMTLNFRSPNGQRFMPDLHGAPGFVLCSCSDTWSSVPSVGKVGQTSEPSPTLGLVYLWLRIQHPQKPEGRKVGKGWRRQCLPQTFVSRSPENVSRGEQLRAEMMAPQAKNTCCSGRWPVPFPAPTWWLMVICNAQRICGTHKIMKANTPSHP